MSLDKLIGAYGDVEKSIIDARDPGNLFKGATWESINTDSELRGFLQRSLDPDGSKYGGDIEALKTDLLNTRTTRDSSILLSAYDFAKSGGENIRQKQVQNLIGRLYESAPNRLTSGDAGQAWEAVKSGAVGALGWDAPINIALAPLSVGSKVLGTVGKSLLTKSATQTAIESAAVRGAETLGKEVTDGIVTDAMKSVALAGAKREAAIGAGTAAVGDAFNQGADINRGNRDEYSLADSALNVAGGAVLGGAIGGLVGGYQGRNLGREITTGVPTSGDKTIMERAGFAEGERSIPEALAQRSASTGPQLPEGYTPRIGGTEQIADLNVTLADAYAQVKSDLSSDAMTVERLRNEVLAGNSKSAYTADQLAAIKSAMTRLADPQRSSEAELRLAQGLDAAGDPDSIRAASDARARASVYQKFAQEMTDDPELLLNSFDNGDINPALVNKLASFDEGLARALNPEQPPASQPAAKGGKSKTAQAAAPAPTRVAQGEAPTAPAPQQPAAPKAAAGEAAPTAPTSGTGAQGAQVVASPKPISGDEISAVSTGNAGEQFAGAAAEIKELAAKLQKDAGELVESLRSMTPEEATKFEVDNSLQPGIKQKAETIADAVDNARAEAAKAEEPAPQADAADAADAADVGDAEVEAQTARLDAMDSVLADQVEATTRITNAMQEASDVHARMTEQSERVTEGVQKELDAIAAELGTLVEGESSAVKLTAEEKLANAQSKLKARIDEIAETDPMLADALSLVKPKSLMSASGISAAVKQVKQAARKAMAWQYATSISRMMSSPMNAVHFGQIIDALPSFISDVDKTFIKGEYKRLVSEAVVSRMEQVGFDNLRKEIGQEALNSLEALGVKLSGGKTGPVKLDLRAIVKSEVEDLDLEPGQVKHAIRAARSAKNFAESAGISMPADVLEAFIRKRIGRSISESVLGIFEFDNAGDIEALAKMREARNRPVSLREVGGRKSVVQNPIIDRLLDEDSVTLVTGRRQGRQVDGTLKLGRPQGVLTDGLSFNGHAGLLWAHPRNAYGAEVAARREILMSAVDRASNQRATMKIAGVKRSGTRKELAGLIAEIQQRLIDNERMETLIDLSTRVSSGTLTRDQADDIIARISSKSRPVTEEERALATMLANSRKQMADSIDEGQRVTNNLLNKMVVDGKKDGEEILKVLMAVNKTYKHHMDTLLSASRDGSLDYKTGRKSSAAKADAKPGAPIKHGNNTHVSKGVVVVAKRDKDSVVTIKVGKGQAARKFNVTAADVLKLGDKGDITLKGSPRRIGSWKADDSGAIEVSIDGMQKEKLSDLSAILNRGTFQDLYQDDLARLVPTTGSKADTKTPVGSVIDKDVVGHTEEVAAKEEILTGRDWNAATKLSELRVKVPEGGRLAIRNKRTGKVYNAQKTDIGVAEALKGKMLDIEDAEFGYIPIGTATRSGGTKAGMSDAAKVNTFTAFGQDPGTRVSQQMKTMVERGDASARVLRIAKHNSITETEAGKIPFEKGTLLSAWNDFAESAVSLQWSAISDINALDTIIQSMTQRAEAMLDVIPHGIRRDNASRRTSMAFLKKHLASAGNEEVEQALRMIRSLDAENFGNPYFYAVEGDSSFTPSGNRVNLGGNQNGLPAHVTVIHETGHWAFVNMLSPAEQIEFIQSLRKFYNADGKLDPASVRKSMPNVAEVEKLLGQTFKGVNASTNELFAWQWTSYALRKMRGEDAVAAELPLWQKVAKYTKAILSKIIGKKTDPDLERLFDRIMPSFDGETKYSYDKAIDAGTGSAVDLANLPQDRKVAAGLFDSMQKIDELRAGLMRVVMHASAPIDAGAKDAIARAADHVYGALLGSKAPRQNGPGSLRRKMSLMRRVAGGKSEALEGSVDPLSLFSKSELGAMKTKLKELESVLSKEQMDSIAMRAIEAEDSFEVELIDMALTSNPEAKLEFERAYERELVARIKAGVSEDAAFDFAEEAAYKAAADLTGIDYRANNPFESMLSDAVASPEQAAAIRRLGENLSDLMGDMLSHYHGKLRRLGVEVPTSRNVAQYARKSVEADAVSDAATKLSKKVPKARKTKKAETPSQAAAADAVQQATVQAAGTGVANGADPKIAPVVARVTHRDKELQDSLQSAAIAMFRALFPDSDYITNKHLSQLTGEAIGELAPDAIADVTSPAFDAFRKALRITAASLKSRNADDAIEQVATLVANARVAQAVDDGIDAGISAGDLAKAIMKGMKDRETLAILSDLEKEAVGDAMIVMQQYKTSDVSSAVMRVIGEENIVGNAHVPAGRYTDGSVPAEIADPMLKISLNSMSDRFKDAILFVADILPDANRTSDGNLLNNIAWRRVKDGALFATPEDATEGGKVKGIVDALQAGDAVELRARIIEAEAAGADDALVPVLVDMRKLMDAADGPVGSAKARKAAGYIGHTDGTRIMLDRGQNPMPLEQAIFQASKRVTDGRNPDAPMSSEFALYAALEGRKPNPVSVEQRSLEAGASRGMAQVVAGMFRKERPTMTDEQMAAIRSSRFMQLSENSVRIARAGGQWLANLIKPVDGAGYFDSLSVRTGTELMPLVEKLDNLGGRTGVFKKTWGGIVENLSFSAKGIPQSPQETSIAMAMRKGDISGLTGESLKVALAIRQHLRSALEMQRKAGITVDDIGENYLPQRFNIPWLAANPDEATRLLAKWFQKDSGDSLADATDRAKKVIFEAINREELHGILDSSSNVYTQAFGDKLYSRKLRIEGGSWDELAPLFDQNLKSLLISYTEASHKRVEWATRFGVNGHAAKSYVEIGRSGARAAVDALMSKGIGMKHAVDDSHGEVRFADELFSAIAKDESEAISVYRDIADRFAAEGDSKKVRDAIVAELTALHQQIGGYGTQHFAKQAEAIVNGIGDFVVQNLRVSEHELTFMDEMVGVLVGRPAYTIKANQGLRNAAGYMRTFNSVTLLSGAVMSSLPDLGGSLIRSGSFKSWMKGLSSAVKLAMGDEVTRAAMQRVSVGIESVLNENMYHLQGSRAGRISNAFFLATGLTQWTNAMRQVAALTGFESIKANQAIVQRERMMGRVGSAKYQRSLRYLRQLGAAHLLDEQPLGSFSDSVKDLKIAEAVHRFTNESVFQPDRNDMPLWTQDPIAGLFWQFKSYPLMMGRMVKRSVKEAFMRDADGNYVGDPAGLAYLATVGAGLGMGSMYLKDVIKGRNEEADEGNPSSEWRTPRDRAFSKIAQEFGFKDYEMDDPEKDAILGWYTEGLLQMGALGFLGDLLYQSAARLDNGEFGKMRVMSQVLGPWLGTMTDAYDVLAGVQDQNEDSNSKERNAARKVLGRLPIIGQDKVMTEGWVNWIAGEAQR